MILSMTGYGKAVGNVGNKKIAFEIRSLNSKQLDLNVRMPSFFSEKEMEIRNEVSKKLVRGKIDVFIHMESKEDSPTKINETLAAKYYSQLKTIAELTEQNHSDLLGTIVRLPDVLVTERPQLQADEWQQIKLLVEQGLNAITEFRASEGAALLNEFNLRINNISNLLIQVEGEDGARKEAMQQKLRKSIEELADNVKIDENRFEQELIYYLEKLDITEEKVRLKNHLEYFTEVLQSADLGEGKKLGFICQEIGREINTMGSKANHAPIQKIVIQMKDELEKIKEQVLNVL